MRLVHDATRASAGQDGQGALSREETDAMADHERPRRAPWHARWNPGRVMAAAFAAGMATMAVTLAVVGAVAVVLLRH